MAQGILQSQGRGNMELEDVGELYFKQLCERSFFQNTFEILGSWPKCFDNLAKVEQSADYSSI
ncbi:hypothetical protein Pyn_05759 [Prunus yedoensis var. nudiflora]|uniref:Disease resistance protein winged helix domain-containing protein n=1 Tax=Prunus yedoensis var. nudiflora TaxID=2094558 RepID=A0A314YN72_PRUYE|nr:hypothetical protein Pyn_05759 [Prunus yedoensis var. nudiflora]